MSFQRAASFNSEDLPSTYIVFDIETNGLLPCYGNRITCICAKTNDLESFQKAGEDERNILSDFLHWIYDTQLKSPNIALISANGKSFDVPFIFTRAVLNAIHLQALRPLLALPHFDLQEITSRKISLSDMATLLLGEPKNGNGLNAIALFYAKNFHDLQEYCYSDVCTTERVYLMYRDLRTQTPQANQLPSQELPIQSSTSQEVAT